MDVSETQHDYAHGLARCSCGRIGLNHYQWEHVHDWLKPGFPTDRPCHCGAVMPPPPF